MNALFFLDNWQLKLSLMIGITLIGLSSFAQTVSDLTPEKKLELIRQELVESVLKESTVVKSTSWIDTNGTLRQSSSFKSNMQVRGIKVLSYDLRNQTAEKRKVYWDNDPKENKTTLEKKYKVSITAKSKNCTALKDTKQFKHLVSMSIEHSPLWNSNNLHAANELKNLIGSYFKETSNTQKTWHLLWSESSVLTPYEKVLTNTLSTPSPWLMQLRISPEVAQEQDGLPKVLRRFSNQDTEFQTLTRLHLRLISKKTNEIFFENNRVVNLNSEHLLWDAPKLRADSLQEIQKITYDWSSAISSKFNCLDFQPQINVAGNSIHLNAGLTSGVTVGDEWLLIDSSLIPRRMIEDGSLKKTVLATVRKTGLYDSELEVLAGSGDAVKTNWLALSTSTQY